MTSCTVSDVELNINLKFDLVTYVFGFFLATAVKFGPFAYFKIQKLVLILVYLDFDLVTYFL